MVSELDAAVAIAAALKVLILVLVEDGLGGAASLCEAYFGGVVLILVLVEDGLGGLSQLAQRGDFSQS